MKRVLPIALSLFLCHCGTEVGNGVAPEEPRTDGNTAGTPTSAPEKSDGVTNDSSAPGSMNQYVFSNSFIAACASPFAESIEGTFVHSANSTSFTVAISADGKKTVSHLDSSTPSVISPAPNAGTYAIEALAASPQVTCSAVTSQTLTDGTVQRSVTLSDGALVQWTLTSGTVTSLKVTTSSMTTESWTKR
jgi:hypothetical protein